MARSVAHENLCRIYDFIEHSRTGVQDSPVPCLTMELLEGEPLSEVLSRSRPLQPDVALDFAEQLSRAVDHLHRNGIIHRDLKPSNIMLVNDKVQPRLVVTDFGLAKLLNDSGSLFESRSDFQAGAPYFMAPEILRGDRPTPASDIYSFGLILDEFVTSSRAFSAESLYSLYHQKLWDQPLKPSTRAESLPKNWEAVILRCLADNPLNRFKSCAAAVESLSAEQLIAPPPVADSDLQPPQKPPGGIKRRLFLAGAIAAVPGAVAVTVADTLLNPATTNIAIFPFENQTRDKNFDYLCEGTTTELIRRLRPIISVQVIPYYESRFKVKNVPERFSLLGTLRASQGKVLLAAQIVDNTTRAVKWDQSFDENPYQSFIDIQSTIAAETVDAMEMLLADSSEASPVKRALLSFSNRLRRVLGLGQPADPPTRNRTAMDLYMKGLHQLDGTSLHEVKEAVSLFERALGFDPGFALAYTAITAANFQLMDMNDRPQADLLRRASELATRAVELRPDLAETQTSLAAVHQMNWDWKESANRFKEAIRLNKKYPRAHRWFGGLMAQFGAFDEALREAQVALDLDRNERSTYVSYGLYLVYAGKYSEAIKLYQQAAANGTSGAHFNLCWACAWRGFLAPPPLKSNFFQQALEEAQTVFRSETPKQFGATQSDKLFAICYALAGDRTKAQPYLARMEDDLTTNLTSQAWLAQVYAALGDSEKALQSLEAAYQRKDRKLLYIKVNPLLSSLRSERRFQDIVRNMGLENSLIG